MQCVLSFSPLLLCLHLNYVLDLASVKLILISLSYEITTTTTTVAYE